ncbi:hypothetical protein BsWGS_27741 [Bradybaena similaris]
MEKFNKFKLFSCLLIFCSLNIFLYRHFSQPGPQFMAGSRVTGSKRTGFESHSTAEKETPVQQHIHSISPEQVNIDSSTKWHITNNQSAKSLLKFDYTTPEKYHNSSPDTENRSLPHTVSSEHNLVKENMFAWTSSNNNLKSTTADGDPVMVANDDKQTLCPVVPPRLNGGLATYMEPRSWEEIGRENPGLQPGGRYKPPDCLARHRVAVIIPYRNREKHLQILLRNLHPILSRQQLDYGIFVIDQAPPEKFNRAMLMNIGYVEAMKRYDYQCAVFHDVDLVPENDRNIYSCPEMPRHMSAAIDKFKYSLPYSNIYGGVSAISRQHFEKVNGFSNMFFGWGGEDDDMSKRIRAAGLQITRYPMEIARYKMIKHVVDSGNERNPMRFGLLKTSRRRMATDGLNSLVYEVKEVEVLPSHLRIQVLIKQSDIIKKKVLPS